MDTTKDGLARLSKLADEQYAAEVEIERLNAELANTTKGWRELAEKQIPDLMEELEMESFTTQAGLRVDVKETIRASLSKGRLADGLEWLRENGQSGIIKSNVMVPFAKGDDSAVQEFLDRLEGEGMAATYEEKVHAGTLSAAVREMLAEGEDVPFDKLGVFVQRAAKIQKK